MSYQSPSVSPPPWPGEPRSEPRRGRAGLIVAVVAAVVVVIVAVVLLTGGSESDGDTDRADAEPAEGPVAAVEQYYALIAADACDQLEVVALTTASFDPVADCDDRMTLFRADDARHVLEVLSVDELAAEGDTNVRLRVVLRMENAFGDESWCGDETVDVDVERHGADWKVIWVEVASQAIFRNEPC